MTSSVLRSPAAAFYAVQKQASEVELSQLRALGVRNLGPHLKDYADTAAAIEHLDLIISVDTSVVHLAGAMAKPVWTLLSHCPDWRWMLDRKDSPWYPNMRLYRQPSPGDWKSVFDDVCHDLQQLVAARSIKSDTIDATRTTKS